MTESKSMNGGYASLSDSEGGSQANGRDGRRRSKRSQQISQLQEINEDLKNENGQLRAQLLEQQEIITREFRRRMEVSGIRVRHVAESNASVGEGSENVASRPVRSASPTKHESVALYQSKYEEAQKELTRVLSGAATLKNQYTETQYKVLTLEKEIDAYKVETEGLRERLCDALEQTDDLQTELQDERRHTQELECDLGTSLEKLRSMSEDFESQLKRVRLETDELESQLASKEEDLKAIAGGSSVKREEIESLKGKVNHMAEQIESQRQDLLDKIERIAQLEEEVEHSQQRSSHANTISMLRDENHQLKKEIKSLSDILSLPEHVSKSALAGLKEVIRKTSQEASELRSKNQVLLEKEREQQQTLRELEYDKRILTHDLDSLNVAYELVKRQIGGEPSLTTDTNSLTSSSKDDPESSSIFEVEENVNEYSGIDDINNSSSSERTDISATTENTTASKRNRAKGLAVFEESDDSCSSADFNKINASLSFCESSDSDDGSDRVLTLLQQPTLSHDTEKGNTTASGISVVRRQNQDVNLGEWLANSMSKWNSEAYSRSSFTSIETKSTFTGSSKEDSALDQPQRFQNRI